MKVPRLPQPGSLVLARTFIFAATVLSAASAAAAVASFVGGDAKDGFLLAGIAVFTAWMATAIHQFQQRIEGIDEVVRQGRSRVEQSEALLEEMRKVARRMSSSASSEDEKEEDRTIH